MAEVSPRRSCSSRTPAAGGPARRGRDDHRLRDDVLVDAFRTDVALLLDRGERMSGPVCRANANLGAVMVAYRGRTL